MPTASPIKHLVVIYDEGASFDHYFGTYPNAANTDGTAFTAAAGTPAVNGLTPALQTANPNEFNPLRLTHSEALTCGQNQGYNAEQQAFDTGAMDMFVQHTGRDTCTGQPILFGQPGLVMDYYDGNTTTALWNYAQQYALSDNSFASTFGPSTPGVVNLVSGETHDFLAVNPSTHAEVTDPSVVSSVNAKGVGTVISEPDPAYDDCSDNGHTTTANLARGTDRNVGDLLNARGVTWGWFQGGFAPTGKNGTYSVCGATHSNVAGNQVTDYVPHLNPFQYYLSTANPHHLPPSSPSKIGQTDQAKHQYDLSLFNTEVSNGVLPAVSFVTPPAYENGQPASSDPLDEQNFLVTEINALQASPLWSSTAVIVAYGSSDGWYDQVASPILNGSNDPAADTAMCNSVKLTGGYQDRCGLGPRLPLLVISPWAKTNAVDHTLTEQASILRFIESNWGTGQLGPASFDHRAGSLSGLFNFKQSNNKRVLLNSDGSVASIAPSPRRRTARGARRSAWSGRRRGRRACPRRRSGRRRDPRPGRGR